MILIGLSINLSFAITNAVRRAVAALSRTARPVCRFSELDQQAIVNFFRAKRAANSVNLTLESVCGELDLICEAALKVLHEMESGVAIPSADQPTDNHF